MAITKYDPFDVAFYPAAPFRMLEDTLNRFFTEPANSRPSYSAVDIRETENELVLKADLPEMKLEDLDIRMENGTLTLKGERKFEKRDEDRGYHRIERSYGSFVRAFSTAGVRRRREHRGRLQRRCAHRHHPEEGSGQAASHQGEYPAVSGAHPQDSVEHRVLCELPKADYARKPWIVTSAALLALGWAPFSLIGFSLTFAMVATSSRIANFMR